MPQDTFPPLKNLVGSPVENLLVESGATKRITTSIDTSLSSIPHDQTTPVSGYESESDSSIEHQRFRRQPHQLKRIAQLLDHPSSDSDSTLVCSNNTALIGSPLASKDEEAPNDEKVVVVEDDRYGDPPDGGLRAWLVVLGSFLVHFLVLGIMYSYGVYQQFYLTQGFASNSELALIGTFTSATMPLLGVVSGRLAERFGFRTMIFIGATLILIALVSASFTTTTLWSLVLTQGFLGGVGASFCFFSAVSVPSQWFSTKRGLATGIAVSGAGGFAVSLIIRKLLTVVSIQWTLRIVGLYTFVGLLFAGALIRNRIPSNRKSKLDWTIWRDYKFQLLFWVGLVNNIGYLIPSTFISVYATQYVGLSADSGALLLSIWNGSSAAGRIFMGFFSDKYLGRVNTLLVCMTLSGASMFLIWMFANNYAILILFVVFNGMFAGGYISSFPVVNADLFGSYRLPSVSGMQSLGAAIGSLMSAPIGGAIIDRYGFHPAIVFAGVSTLVAACFVFAVKISHNNMDFWSFTTAAGTVLAAGAGVALTYYQQAKAAKEKKFQEQMGPRRRIVIDRTPARRYVHPPPSTPQHQTNGDGVAAPATGNANHPTHQFNINTPQHQPFTPHHAPADGPLLPYAQQPALVFNYPMVTPAPVMEIIRNPIRVHYRDPGEVEARNYELSLAAAAAAASSSSNPKIPPNAPEPSTNGLKLGKRDRSTSPPREPHHKRVNLGITDRMNGGPVTVINGQTNMPITTPQHGRIDTFGLPDEPASQVPTISTSRATASSTSTSTTEDAATMTPQTSGSRSRKRSGYGLDDEDEENARLEAAGYYTGSTAKKRKMGGTRRDSGAPDTPLNVAQRRIAKQKKPESGQSLRKGATRPPSSLRRTIVPEEDEDEGKEDQPPLSEKPREKAVEQSEPEAVTKPATAPKSILKKTGRLKLSAARRQLPMLDRNGLPGTPLKKPMSDAEIAKREAEMYGPPPPMPNQTRPIESKPETRRVDFDPKPTVKIISTEIPSPTTQPPSMTMFAGISNNAEQKTEVPNTSVPMLATTLPWAAPVVTPLPLHAQAAVPASTSPVPSLANSAVPLMSPIKILDSGLKSTAPTDSTIATPTPGIVQPSGIISPSALNKTAVKPLAPFGDIAATTMPTFGNGKATTSASPTLPTFTFGGQGGMSASPGQQAPTPAFLTGSTTIAPAAPTVIFGAKPVEAAATTSAMTSVAPASSVPSFSFGGLPASIGLTLGVPPKTSVAMTPASSTIAPPIMPFTLAFGSAGQEKPSFPTDPSTPFGMLGATTSAAASTIATPAQTPTAIVFGGFAPGGVKPSTEVKAPTTQTQPPQFTFGRPPAPIVTSSAPASTAASPAGLVFNLPTSTTAPSTAAAATTAPGMAVYGFGGQQTGAPSGFAPQTTNAFGQQGQNAFVGPPAFGTQQQQQQQAQSSAEASKPAVMSFGNNNNSINAGGQSFQFGAGNAFAAQQPAAGTPSQPQPNASITFGSPAIPPSTLAGGFGSPSIQPTQGFGSPSVQAHQPFGSPSVTPGNVAPVFGGGQAATTAPKTFRTQQQQQPAFGTQQQQQPAFGIQPQQQQPNFGGFGQNIGQQQQQPNGGQTVVNFGGSPAGFGGQSQQQQQQTPGGFAAFGNNGQQQGAGNGGFAGFGNQQGQQPQQQQQQQQPMAVANGFPGSNNNNTNAFNFGQPAPAQPGQPANGFTFGFTAGGGMGMPQQQQQQQMPQQQQGGPQFQFNAPTGDAMFQVGAGDRKIAGIGRKFGKKGGGRR
ncbi:hypothetical protein SmJEL517_g00766 [Synchytrium microbalum]|uniref:Major facilitator superfamily (MFS) profile domain-containing protein n=1 Tax=Synchytrium microbalum TaxID=1806994 RepID=A0A507CE55_9FUNG|nr:uncharacterized protein SmJEL517_g00766 [Synchytrium microbalum]TPX37459.1 hypothetical protein SmJEL517_g00766 [Synchytrium microbalum]